MGNVLGSREGLVPILLCDWAAPIFVWCPLPVTSTHSSLRHPNPILHGVPFCVIPNQQAPLRAVRALETVFVLTKYRLMRLIP